MIQDKCKKENLAIDSVPFEGSDGHRKSFTKGTFSNGIESKAEDELSDKDPTLAIYEKRSSVHSATEAVSSFPVTLECKGVESSNENSIFSFRYKVEKNNLQKVRRIFPLMVLEYLWAFFIFSDSFTVTFLYFLKFFYLISLAFPFVEPSSLG